MSWYALSHGFLESTDQTNIWTPVRMPQQSPRPVRSLGAATADARWRWASPNAGSMSPAPAAARRDEVIASRAAEVRIARNVRAEMAEMAYALGRSEDDIWTEAAREWLMRRLRNHEPPPTTPAAAPVPGERPRRLWGEIDAMLAELRHPRYVAAPSEPTAPAA